MTVTENVVLVRIEGKVQGVGYRAFAARRAVALGLRGWVRNIGSGAVEALVAGPPERIDAFIEACRAGPPRASVRKVGREPAATEAAGALIGFIIAPDGRG